MDKMDDLLKEIRMSNNFLFKIMESLSHLEREASRNSHKTN